MLAPRFTARRLRLALAVTGAVALSVLAVPATCCAAGYLPVAAWGDQGTTPGHFLGPKGIAVDGDGFVYVADFGGDRIDKFTADGQLVLSWGVKGVEPGQLRAPSRLATGPDGSLYVTDAENDRIQRFSANGELLDLWGGPGDGPGQFKHPRGVGVAADGSVYVTDAGNARIQVFTANGEWLRTWGRRGIAPGRFLCPKDVAVGADGRVYTVDAKTNRLQVFTTSGRLLAWWGGLGSAPGRLNGPRGLAIDTDGDILVADAFNQRLQEFSPDGVLLRLWSCRGVLPGLTHAPRDIAVAPDGSLMVSDTGNCRVQRFALAGGDDDDAPITAGDAPSGWQRQPVTVSLASSDADSGVRVTYARIGRSADFNVCSAPVVFAKDGVHRLQYLAVDNAGNQERMRTSVIRIDQPPPTVRPRWTAAAAVDRGHVVSLRCTVADRTSPRCRITLVFLRDGAQVGHRSLGWQRVSARGRQLDLSFVCRLAPGTYWLLVRAQDLAGNQGESTGILLVH
jgi:DNA-binding beta-propeller fold protein YncE